MEFKDDVNGVPFAVDILNEDDSELLLKNITIEAGVIYFPQNMIILNTTRMFWRLRIIMATGISTIADSLSGWQRDLRGIYGELQWKI